MHTVIMLTLSMGRASVSTTGKAGGPDVDSQLALLGIAGILGRGGVGLKYK
jgi:hypothetical protein